MALKTNYKFLSIGDDKNIFVENYSYDLAAKEKSGQLFVIIEIRNNPSNARATGEKIFDTMRKYFSANLNEESHERFKNPLKEVNKVLDDLHSNDLDILIGFIAGKDLYLTQTGAAVAYLVRNNSIEIISQGLSEKRAYTFTNIAKGEVKAGDFIVFSSVSLFQYISRIDLAKVLKAGALTDSLSGLNELISTKISGKAGIIGMTFEKISEKLPRKLPRKLPAKLSKIRIPKIRIPKIKIKTPMFLINIVNAIKNSLLSAEHSIGTTFKKLSHKWLGIFVVVILIFGITWYAKDSALIRGQVSTTVVKEQYVIKGQDDKKVAETIKEATETILDNNIRQVENPKVFVDFSTKQPDINLRGLLALEGKIFAFEQNKLYEISSDKIEELAAFNDDETVVFATDFENQGSLIFTTKSGKLIQYKNAGISPVRTADGEFSGGIAIDDWSDRIYILDPDKNQIWRYFYLLSYDVFGSATEYYTDDSLKNVVDFAIDGFVYLLYRDGSIDKLHGGRKQDFSIQDKPFTEFDTPSKIYTEDGLNQIFVMDSGNSRIFIYDKDLKTGNAVYHSQIVFPAISDLRDLYVDKNANKLYLLDAQKVYEIQL